MKFLHDLFEKQRPLFEKGGKFEKYYYLFEAQETFVFTPPSVTKPKGAQIKDAVDLKRLMITVLIAMIPCLIFGLWNAGHQHFLAIGEAEASFMDEDMRNIKMLWLLRLHLRYSFLHHQIPPWQLLLRKWLQKRPAIMEW